jgi:hypothetical protein
MPITTEVLEKGPAHFNQCGQFLHYPLRESEGKISQRLAQRLVKYAEIRAKELGLSRLIQEWRVGVGTLDGDAAVEDRGYYVEWVNAEKTTISIVGILIQNGRPILDHGVEIESN